MSCNFFFLLIRTTPPLLLLPLRGQGGRNISTPFARTRDLIHDPTINFDEIYKDARSSAIFLVSDRLNVCRGIIYSRTSHPRRLRGTLFFYEEKTYRSNPLSLELLPVNMCSLFLYFFLPVVDYLKPQLRTIRKLTLIELSLSVFHCPFRVRSRLGTG